MDFNHFHFSNPFCLFALLAVPVIWICYFLFFGVNSSHKHLEKYIDKHLLQYLLVKSQNKKSFYLRFLSLWTFSWIFLTLALAGPRWDYREIESFSKDQNLVILIDLSESMNASDVKPSRLKIAKQKIEDLLNASVEVKIGLVAFAADPHIITPLTEDKESVRHFLPSLDTSLVYVQGSRLASALEMAFALFKEEQGSNNSILLISDGGFEDASAFVTAKKLADSGIIIHAMGVGTLEGAPVQNSSGGYVKKNGATIISKLQKEKLSQIASTGNGRYLEASFSNSDEEMILKDLEKRSEATIAKNKKSRIWEEHFYLFLFPALPAAFFWFRRGAIFAFIIFSFPPFFNADASITDYFKNSEEHGAEAFESGDYEKAAACFEDAYRKGVACYKAKDFEAAEKLFSASTRQEVSLNALYNLGNALAHQQKFKEAAGAYEEALKKDPEHKKSKDNLEIIKKILEEQNQNNKNSENKQENQDSESQQENQDPENNSRQDDKSLGNPQDKESEKNKSNEEDSPDTSDERKSPLKNQEKTNEVNPPNQPEKKPSAFGQEALKERGQTGDAAEERAAEQPPEKDLKKVKAAKTQEDFDADLWLNRIENDPKTFMKNKFYVESKKNETKEGVDPW